MTLLSPIFCHLKRTLLVTRLPGDYGLPPVSVIVLNLILSLLLFSYQSIEKDVVILRKISPGEKIHR